MAGNHLEAFSLQNVKGLGVNAVKGSGAYGTVYDVTVDGMQCIAKRMHAELTGRKVSADQKSFVLSKFREECVLMSQLRHPNVVHFVGVYFGSKPDDLSLILECLHTDLACYLTKTSIISDPTKLSIVLDISYGLLYLHTREPAIIHRDLTANNVLLTGDLRAKIADLGVSKVLDIHRQAELSQTKVPGSQYYMPPEALQENPQYDCKLDIFSFGHLMIFIATQAFPQVYERVSQQALKEGTIQILKRKASLELMGREHPLDTLVLHCLLDDPKRRPTALKVNAAVKQIHSKNIDTQAAQDVGKLKELAEKYKTDITRLVNEKNAAKEEAASLKKQLDREIPDRAKLAKSKLPKKTKEMQEKMLQSEEQTEALKIQVSLLAWENRALKRKERNDLETVFIIPNKSNTNSPFSSVDDMCELCDDSKGPLDFDPTRSNHKVVTPPTATTEFSYRGNARETSTINQATQPNRDHTNIPRHTHKITAPGPNKENNHTISLVAPTSLPTQTESTAVIARNHTTSNDCLFGRSGRKSPTSNDLHIPPVFPVKGFVSLPTRLPSWPAETDVDTMDADLLIKELKNGKRCDYSVRSASMPLYDHLENFSTVQGDSLVEYDNASMESEEETSSFPGDHINNHTIQDVETQTFSHQAKHDPRYNCLRRKHVKRSMILRQTSFDNSDEEDSKPPPTASSSSRTSNGLHSPAIRKPVPPPRLYKHSLPSLTTPQQ